LVVPHTQSLHALTEPSRRAVFKALAQGPCRVSALAETRPVSRLAVSQHLKILTEAGLVTVRTQCRRRICALRPKGRADLRAWLDRYRDVVMVRFASEISNAEEPQ
jgi:DNA-binding transcriptional ArsR family regulator